MNMTIGELQRQLNQLARLQKEHKEIIEKPITKTNVREVENELAQRKQDLAIIENEMKVIASRQIIIGEENGN